jgi:hypothetical protein
MTATTRTSSAYVKWQPKQNVVGPNVVLFNEVMTASMSGIMWLLKIPHGARIVSIDGMAGATGLDIGDLSDTDRYVSVVSATFGILTTTGLGYTISVTDSQILRYTILTGKATSAAYSGTIKFALTYLFDGQAS